MLVQTSDHRRDVRRIVLKVAVDRNDKRSSRCAKTCMERSGLSVAFTRWRVQHVDRAQTRLVLQQATEYVQCVVCRSVVDNNNFIIETCGVQRGNNLFNERWKIVPLIVSGRDDRQVDQLRRIRHGTSVSHPRALLRHRA